jgi:hypothetical protein
MTKGRAALTLAVVSEGWRKPPVICDFQTRFAEIQQCDRGGYAPAISAHVRWGERGTRPVPSGSSCDTGSLGTEHLSDLYLRAAGLKAQILFDA